MREQQATIESWFTEDAVLGLKSDGKTRWLLRHDVHRALLIEQRLSDMRLSSHFLVEPIEAVLLAHLNGRTPLSSIISRFGDLLSLDAADAKRFVARVLERKYRVLEEARHTREYPSYDPRDFVVRKDDIDMRRDRLYRPISISAFLSEDCRRSCRYCSAEKRVLPTSSFLPLQRWNAVVDELSGFGISWVTLCGGEPFLRSEIFDILAVLSEGNIVSDIITKAFITRAMAEKLALHKVSSVRYSVDALDPALADHLTGSANFFQTAMESIRNLVTCGVVVRTNTVVTPLNVRQIPDLVKFLAELGVSRMGATQYWNSPYVPDASQFLLDPKDGQWLQEQVRGLSAHYDVDFEWQEDQSLVARELKKRDWPDRALCGGGRLGFVIRADGRISLCAELPLEDQLIVGDLTQQTVMEVWNSANMTALLCPRQDQFSGVVCSNCESFSQCHESKGRCLRDALRAYGTVFAPDPRCPEAPPHFRLV